MLLFQLQKQLKSVVLALLLIGYKCSRASLTESCFLKVNDFVKCTNSLLKSLAYGELPIFLVKLGFS